MKILVFGILVFGLGRAEIKCVHPKISQLEKAIRGHKSRREEYGTASRAYAATNNEIRRELQNLTADLEDMEVSIEACANFVKSCASSTLKCPREVLNCLQTECHGRYGLSTNLIGRVQQSGQRCYLKNCQPCRKCECKQCDQTCTEPWMLDAKRYRKDFTCIVENYQLLRMEKLDLATKETAGRTKYNVFKNNHKILTAELALKRKHFAEYKEHYEQCAATLKDCEIQLEECRNEVFKCRNTCKISNKYLRGSGRYKTILFRQERYSVSKLSNVISCPEWGSNCPDCDRCYCERCPRCIQE